MTGTETANVGSSQASGAEADAHHRMVQGHRGQLPPAQPCWQGKEEELARLHKDLYWGLYAELRAHMRHAETLRASGATAAMAVAAALLTIIGVGGTLNGDDKPFAWILTALGVAAGLFAASSFARYEEHRRRASNVLMELDARFQTGGAPKEGFGRMSLRELTHAELARKNYDPNFKSVIGSPHVYWVLFPATICGTGLILLFLLYT